MGTQGVLGCRKQLRRLKGNVMAKKKRKRLVRGKHWHGWAYRSAYTGGFCFWAEAGNKPKESPDDEPGGKWERVKFVEVPCKP